MNHTLPNHYPTEELLVFTGREVMSRWLLVLLGAFLLNVVCYVILTSKPVNKTAAVMQHKWELLANSDALDLLILGDSSGHQGVDPDVLKNMLHINSLNLCTTGGSVLLDDRMMLEDYLAKQTPPRAVLLIHAYDVWSRSLNMGALSFFPQSLDQLNQRIGRNGLTDVQYFSVLARRYLPIHYQNESLAQIIYHPADYLNLQRQFTATGFEARSKSMPDFWKADVRMHYQIAKRNRKIEVSPENIENLQQMTALADQHGFELFVVMSPIASELYAQEPFRHYYQQIPAWLDAYAQQHPRVHLLLKQPLRVTSDQMQSADHVCAEAATYYSQLIGEHLRELFAHTVLESGR